MHLTPTIKEESFKCSEVLLKQRFWGLGRELSRWAQGEQRSCRRRPVHPGFLCCPQGLPERLCKPPPSQLSAEASPD